MLAAVAIIALIGVMVAPPASAQDQKPLSGKMELTNFSVQCGPTPEAGPPFLTWAGTVIIDGTTYGWADFPTAPLIEDGKFISFEEYWTIFRLDEDEVVDPGLACDADRVVLAGVNDGWGAPGGAAKADGTVTLAESDGPFDDVAIGSRMFWRGRVTEFSGAFPFEFEATLHIQATR